MNKDNPIYDLRSRLLLCKNQQDFDYHVEWFCIKEMQTKRKYNMNSFFTEKEPAWRKKLIDCIIRIASLDKIFFDLEVNSDYDFSNFVFRKIEK